MAIKEPQGDPIVLLDGTQAPFSPAFRAGDQLFVSGQLAFNDDGSLNTGDIQEQTRRCLEQIEAILKRSGLTKNDIARVGIWITNAADFGEFNKAYAAFFGDHRPARACVVSELVLPGAKVEIDAVAYY